MKEWLGSTKIKLSSLDLGPKPTAHEKDGRDMTVAAKGASSFN